MLLEDIWYFHCHVGDLLVSACMFPISVFMKCVFTDHSAEKDAWGASFFPYVLFFIYPPIINIGICSKYWSGSKKNRLFKYEVIKFRFISIIQFLIIFGWYSIQNEIWISRLFT